jgi:hypothetical protein
VAEVLVEEPLARHLEEQVAAATGQHQITTVQTVALTLAAAVAAVVQTVVRQAAPAVPV